MPLIRKAPFWWYGSESTLTAFLLDPIALAWNLVTRARWALAKPYRSSLPVICVGNLTAGGGGKTPTAILIANLLKSIGESPVFLSRGYGGSIKGPHLVDTTRDTASEVGDEPLLLAEIAPVVVSADRMSGARFAETLDASVIIMDDGFQNPHVEKDFSVLVVDGEAGIGNGLIIPAGPLRASLHFQMPRAQALITVGDGKAGKVVSERAAIFDLPSYQAHMTPQGSTRWLKGKSVVAFAGIALPEKFFRSLEEAGAQIRDRVSFADHHVYSERNAEKLLEKAAQSGAILVTTRKDKKRMKGQQGALAKLNRDTRELPVSLQLDEEDAFLESLRIAIERKRKS